MNTKPLTLFSLNARGLNTYQKRITLFDWLKDAQFDIIFLQETHFVKENEHIYNSRWFGEKYHALSDSVFSRGVSILFRKNLNVDIINYHQSVNGRKLLINVKINEKVFSLVNVYAPNSEKERTEFFKRLQAWIDKYTLNTDGLILCGDFNCQVENCNDKNVNLLRKLLNHFALNDA